MDNLFQTLSKLIIETFIRKIRKKYLKAISHPNIYIYYTTTLSCLYYRTQTKKLSQDMSNSFRINNMSSTVKVISMQ